MRVAQRYSENRHKQTMTALDTLAQCDAEREQLAEECAAMAAQIKELQKRLNKFESKSRARKIETKTDMNGGKQ